MNGCHTFNSQFCVRVNVKYVHILLVALTFNFSQTLFTKTKYLYEQLLKPSKLLLLKMITIFSFLTTIIFFFYLASGAPLLNVNNDQKLMNGQAFYKSFNLFDLPLVGNRQPPKMEDVSSVSNHQVNADLAVVSSAEADPSGPEPFTGYGEAVETPRTDMFLINAPGDGQEQHRETEFKPIGVVPKLTGKILAPLQKHQLPADKNEAAVINPTAYFLEGADLDKVRSLNA